MSSPVHARGVVDQFSQERTLRIRLLGDGRAISFSALGLGPTDRLSIALGNSQSVSSHDVVAADPDPLTVPPAPVSRLPDIIRVAVPISRPSIIRSIPAGNHH